MLILLLLAFLPARPATAGMPPPVISAPESVVSETKDEVRDEKTTQSLFSHFTQKVADACQGYTAGVPENIRKYCASSKFTRYFWQKAKSELQKEDSLTPDLATALDGENPCLDYYEGLVKAWDRAQEEHRQKCLQLSKDAESARAKCSGAESCLTEQTKLVEEATQAQEQYFKQLSAYGGRIKNFEKGNQRYMAHLKEEVKNFSSMPAAKQLQKESKVSEPLTLANLRGIDAAGQPVRAHSSGQSNSQFGASATPSETHRVDAARTQSANLAQHQQRLEEASSSAINLQKEIGEHRETVEKEKKQVERTAAKLEENERAMKASASDLASMNPAMLGTAAGLLGSQSKHPGGVSPPGVTSGPGENQVPLHALAAAVGNTTGVKPNSDSKPEATDNSTARSLQGTLRALDQATNGKKAVTLDYSLRDGLKKTLAAAAADAARAMIGESAPGDTESKAGKAALSLLRSAAEEGPYAGGGGFPGGTGGSSPDSAPISLANSETEAQVSHMIGELEGAGVQVEGAQPEADGGATLFRRVTVAYLKIQKRGGP